MKQRKRIAALLLSAAMIFQPSGVIVLAAEDDLPNGASKVEICTHHTHNESCGYAEAIPGADCTHEHDESCGFVEAVGEVPCDKGCADGGHAADCAYTPAKEGVDCSHQQHDGECGYIEGTKGSSCTFVCEICNEESGEPEDSTCGCTTPCTEETVNKDCPVCSAGRRRSHHLRRQSRAGEKCLRLRCPLHRGNRQYGLLGLWRGFNRLQGQTRTNPANHHHQI